MNNDILRSNCPLFSKTVVNKKQKISISAVFYLFVSSVLLLLLVFFRQVGSGGGCHPPDRDALRRPVLPDVRGPQEDARLEGSPGGAVGQVQDAGESLTAVRTFK